MSRALDLGYKEGKKSIISNKRDFTSLENKSTSCMSQPSTMLRLTVVEGDIITWGTIRALNVNREKTRQY